MLKILCATTALVLVLATQSFAQNRNTSAQTGAATSGRTSSANSTTTTPAPASRAAARQTPASEPSTTTTTRTRRAAASQTAKDPLAEGVIAAFDNLIEGIRRADVNAVTSVYWNSPQLDPLQLQRDSHQRLGADAPQPREFLPGVEGCQDHDQASVACR